MEGDRGDLERERHPARRLLRLREDGPGLVELAQVDEGAGPDVEELRSFPRLRSSLQPGRHSLERRPGPGLRLLLEAGELCLGEPGCAGRPGEAQDEEGDGDAPAANEAHRTPHAPILAAGTRFAPDVRPLCRTPDLLCSTPPRLSIRPGRDEETA